MALLVGPTSYALRDEIVSAGAGVCFLDVPESRCLKLSAETLEETTPIMLAMLSMDYRWSFADSPNDPPLWRFPASQKVRLLRLSPLTNCWPVRAKPRDNRPGHQKLEFTRICLKIRAFSQVLESS